MKAEEMLWMSDACVTMTQSRFLRFLLLISSFSSFIATTVRLASCAAAAAAVVVVASSGHALCSTGRGCRSIRSILYAYASLCVCVCSVSHSLRISSYRVFVPLLSPSHPLLTCLSATGLELLVLGPRPSCPRFPHK